MIVRNVESVRGVSLGSALFRRSIIIFSSRSKDPRDNADIHPNQKLNTSEQREFESAQIYLSMSALNPLIRFRIMQIQRRANSARRAPTSSTAARGRDTLLVALIRAPGGFVQTNSRLQRPGGSLLGGSRRLRFVVCGSSHAHSPFPRK